MEKFLTTYEKSFFDRAEKSVGAEINLQEYLPGAVKIIKVRAVGVAEETEVQKDGIFIRGCVRFSAVYRSDFRDRLKCAVFTQEFSHTFPARGIGEALADDGFWDVSVYVSEEKGHVLSPRRLAVSCKVTVGIEAVCAGKSRIYGSDNDAPLERLCKEIDTLSLKKLGDFAVSLRESVSLEEGMPKIREIVCCDMNLCSLTGEIRDGEAVFTGTASLSCMYLGESEDESGQYVSFSKDIPFTERFPVMSVSPDAFLLCKGVITESGANPEQDSYGEASLCSVSAEIKIAARAYESARDTVICDVFSTEHDCDCEVRDIAYDDFICGICDTVTTTESIKASLGSITEVVSRSAEVFVVSCERSGDNLVYGLRAILGICGTTDTGNLESAGTSFNFRVQGTSSVCADAEKCNIDSSVYVRALDCRIENGEIRCVLTLDLNSSLYARKSIRAVTAASTDTESRIRRDKSEYIIYYPEGTETVWSAAKKYRVSPRSLLAVNGMSEDAASFGDKRAVVIPRNGVK